MQAGFARNWQRIFPVSGNRIGIVGAAMPTTVAESEFVVWPVPIKQRIMTRPCFQN